MENWHRANEHSAWPALLFCQLVAIIMPEWSLLNQYYKSVGFQPGLGDLLFYFIPNPNPGQFTSVV
jgi:hypothetical protein